MTEAPARKTVALVAALAAALAFPARGGAVQAAGGLGAAETQPRQARTGGGLVLTLPVSARALGAADATAAASPDEWALFAAPAQLAGLGAVTAGVATEAYLASTRLSAVAVAMPALGGTVGVGATVLDYGSIEEVASSIPGVDGSLTGRRYSAQESAFLLGYGRTIATRLRVGAALELLSTRVADLTASAVAGSASLGWAANSGWVVAAGLSHAGGDVVLGLTRGALPLTESVTIGAPALRVRGWALHPVLDARNVRGAGSSASGAVEAEWSRNGKGLTLRSGYTWRGYANDRWPVSLGFGAALGRIAFDYAAERFPTIGQLTHRVGIRYARAASTRP